MLILNQKNTKIKDINFFFIFYKKIIIDIY